MPTVFQRLNKAFGGNTSVPTPTSTNYTRNVHSYAGLGSNDVIYATRSKEDYIEKLAQLRQQRLLAKQWKRAQYETQNNALANMTEVQMMYREADMMDLFPEIGAALDIYMEEATYVKPNGMMINVTSKSERIKSILEDLIYNRLSADIMFPMITRSTVKYGNTFMLLNVTEDNGIIGWKQLPVYEMQRFENGMDNPYSSGFANVANIDVDSPDSTKFVWVGKNEFTPYRNWQIAHFRLLYDSLYLPYGCITGNSRIETKDGYKEMKDITIGDEVWTFNIDKQERELSTVTFTKNQGIKQVYRIGTFHNEIEATDDHKFLIYENDNLKYKEVKDIRIGDLLVIDNTTSKQDNIVKIDKSYPTEKEANLNKSMRWWTEYTKYIPDFVDESFAKFFGFMIGDGWVSQNNNKVCFATSVYDSLNKEFVDYLEKISGKKCKYIEPYNKNNNNYQFSQVIANAKSVALVLKRMGFSGKFNEKRIPSWVFSTTDNIKKAFLSGIMTADGSYNIDKYGVLRCNIEMSNEELIRDIKTLVQSLGYKSSRIKSRNRIGKTSTLKDGYQIISRHESFYFYYYESFNKQEVKYDLKNRLNNGFKTERIRIKEYVGEKEVYDFTVENNNSNFFANGIVTHNCSALNKARRHWRMLSMMEDMMLMYRLERSVERRVYKVNVGGIDEQDVPAYMDEVANNFKRTPIVDPLTGQLDLRRNIMPVWKNTPIPLLDGRVVTIEQLAKEYDNGKENYVYSVQEGTHKIVPGKIVWCGKNYTAESMIKVTLDDGGYVVLAPEHEFIMRDGSRKRADEIMVGDSVMPFYTKCDKKSEKRMDRYEQTYNPNSGKFEYTHRLIANEVEKPACEYKKINTVHHIDYNKYNNNPNNLLWCNFDDHKKMHSQVGKNNWSDPDKKRSTSAKISETKLEYYRTHEFPEEIKNKISNTLKKTFSDPKYKEFFKERGQVLVEYSRTPEGRQKTSRVNREQHRYEKYFKPYNHSELHREHNKIRSASMRNFWMNGDAESTKRKMTVVFDEFIWNEIRMAILNGIIYNRITMLEYINTYLIEHLLEINTNGRLHNLSRISRSVLEERIHEIGFNTITEYISSIKKNHKVVAIEIVEGDDVYCMTVEGLNGEDDRHNFAVCGIGKENEKSGCFVSNCQMDDYFIPVRDGNDPTSIDNLAAGNNLTAMDDIKFVQNKLCTALRVPKSFLNFEEAAGDGKNLSLLDVRFTKTVNRVQQMMIMELTKVCIIHLYLLGFEDDLTNFSLTMNNPSSQAEMMELDNLSKKIEMAKSAVADPGGGLPLYSITRAQKEILGWSDKQISDNLEELRLEKALAAELEQTVSIIKRTGLFDKVDNLYGEPGAEYSNNAGGQGQEDGMGGGAPGGGMPGGLDMGDDMGGDVGGEMPGAEGDMSMDDAAESEGADVGDDSSSEPLNEVFFNRLMQKTINEKREVKQNLMERTKHYQNLLLNKINESKLQEEKELNVPLYTKSFLINEELNSIANGLSKHINEKK